MATIWEEVRNSDRKSNVDTLTVHSKIKNLEKEVEFLRRDKETQEQSKPFKVPFKWNFKFRQSRKPINRDKALVLFFNKKNEIEPPMFLPIYENIIIYKNKAYEFDPRGIWRWKGVKGVPNVYCIREIDRRPIRNPDGTWKKVDGRIVYSRDAAISNMDIDEVRERGDSTESDEILIKAALKAYVSGKEPMKMNWLVIGIVAVVVIIGGYLLLSGKIGGA